MGEGLRGFRELLDGLGTLRHGGVVIVGIGPVLVRRILCRTLDDAERVAGFLHDEGMNVFFGPNPVKGTHGRPDVLCCVCAHIDYDRPGSIPSDPSVPPMSARVYSGRGQHGYWFYKEPIPVADGEAINRGIAEVLRGDACWDASRVLRVPGTTNHKNGKTVTDVPLPWRPRHDASAFPRSKTPIEPPEDAQEPLGLDVGALGRAKPSEAAQRHYEALKHLRDRSRADWRLACTMFGDDAPAQEVAEALWAAPWAKAPNSPFRYTVRTIRKAAAEVRRTAAYAEEIAI